MQDPFLEFGRFNQGGSGGRQTRVIRRVYVSNDSPTQLSTLDPFLTSRFQPMFPTMEPSMNMMITRRFYHVDDSPPSSPPSKPEPPEETHLYYPNEYYRPPLKANPPKETLPYDPVKNYKPPPKANPPMISEGYYGNGFSNYPPRYDPPGGNPVHLNVNLHLRPEDLRQLYAGNGNFNGQTGGGGYNPQVQGGNKVGGDGKITLGPDINGGNINIGGGKAGGGNVGGGKKKNKDNDSSDDDDDDDRAK